MLDESDTIVENFLKIHYLTKDSYVEKVCKLVIENL